MKWYTRLFLGVAGIFLLLMPLWVYLEPSKFSGTDKLVQEGLACGLGILVGSAATIMALCGSGPEGMYD